MRALSGHGAAGRRLLVAPLLLYAAAYAVMALGARRAGRAGRSWAREEWRASGPGHSLIVMVARSATGGEATGNAG
ncbi:hypothetical protein ACF1GT_18525 [Streptomyces sp. NPDC014636]|uniref:hypothetical protein n=1 Tax=Streptomyces sp. NPDC014636 TaxID=3364876 RepID=UPI0036FBBEF2